MAEHGQEAAETCPEALFSPLSPQLLALRIALKALKGVALMKDARVTGFVASWTHPPRGKRTF